jgi:hypothetical protein
LCSEKQRIPAWCDRILYRGAGMSPWLYGRSELLTSDHKPVKALYDAHVVVVDHALRRHLSHELHRMLPGISAFAEDPLRPLLLAGTAWRTRTGTRLRLSQPGHEDHTHTEMQRRSAALRGGAAGEPARPASAGPPVPPTPPRPAPVGAFRDEIAAAQQQQQPTPPPPPTPPAAKAATVGVLIDLDAWDELPRPSAPPAAATMASKTPAVPAVVAPLLWEAELEVEDVALPPPLPTSARPVLLEPMRPDLPVRPLAARPGTAGGDPFASLLGGQLGTRPSAPPAVHASPTLAALSATTTTMAASPGPPLPVRPAYLQAYGAPMAAGPPLMPLSAGLPPFGVARPPPGAYLPPPPSSSGLPPLPRRP